MANFKRLWSSVLLALCFQGSFAIAQLSAGQKARLQESVQIYNQSKTLGGLVKNLRPGLTDEQYRFLLGKIAGSENERLVPLKMSGSDALSIVADGTTVHVQYVSFADHVIRVNSKSVDLGTSNDMETQWQLIIAALPHRQTNALFDLLIPRAEAFWPIIAGIGGVAIGIYWLIDGDRCDTLAEPLVNCSAALRRFDTLQKAHQAWPWEGTTAEKLKMARAEGVKSCENSDNDCKDKKSLLTSGACTPSWAAEMDKSDVLASAIGALKVRTMKWRASAGTMADAALERHGYDGSALVCKDYPALQQCLTKLIHKMDGVCIESRNLPNLNKALDKPEDEAIK